MYDRMEVELRYRYDKRRNRRDSRAQTGHEPPEARRKGA